MKQILVAVLFCSVIFVSTTARRCYVCGNSSDEPFKNVRINRGSPVNGTLTITTTITSLEIKSCKEFEQSSSLDQFIMNCPDKYVACLTQIDGTDITRTCDTPPLNDCQTANKVKYCYCNTDLCNGKLAIPIPTQTTTSTIRHHNFQNDDTDDEDFLESSGMNGSNLNENNANGADDAEDDDDGDDDDDDNGDSHIHSTGRNPATTNRILTTLQPTDRVQGTPSSVTSFIRIKNNMSSLYNSVTLAALIMFY